MKIVCDKISPQFRIILLGYISQSGFTKVEDV